MKFFELQLWIPVLFLFYAVLNPPSDASNVGNVGNVGNVSKESPAVRAFTDITEKAGLAHLHHKAVLDSKLSNIMPWMSSVGAAAAAGDYDNDGDTDIYVTNSQKGYPNALYRNNGNMTFTDVAQEARVAWVNEEKGGAMAQGLPLQFILFIALLNAYSKISATEHEKPGMASSPSKISEPVRIRTSVGEL